LPLKEQDFIDPGDVPRRGSVFRYRHQEEKERKDENGELRDLMNVGTRRRRRMSAADSATAECTCRPFGPASGEVAEIS
jgi:hypothetical protein